MRTTLVLATALMLSSLPAFAAGGGARVPLASVAARGGYASLWAADHSSVVLSRPGIVVVLRPGESVYQVNDQAAVADGAPRYERGDLYVTASLADRLAVLASRSPSLGPTAGDTTIAQSDAIAHGSILLEAHQLQGAEALDIAGIAPPGSPVTITLLAMLSTDLPTILVSRHDVVTDVNGRFRAVIPVASAYERGTLLRVVATSLPGVSPASTQLVIGAPNAGVTIPLEQPPHPARYPSAHTNRRS